MLNAYKSLLLLINSFSLDPNALTSLVLIPAGLAPSGTITFTACRITVIFMGKAGPGSPSISVSRSEDSELTVISFP